MHSETQENNSQLIDVNNDGLDDRLVEDEEPVTRNVQDIIDRVKYIQIQELSEIMLVLMQEEVQQKMDEKLQQAIEGEQRLHKVLIQGQYSSFSSIKKNIRYLYQEYGKLEDKKRRLENYIQEKRLRRNILERLTEDGTRIAEVTSLILTFLILSLLVYDIYVERPADHILSVWNIFYIDIVCCIFFQWEFFFRYSCAEDKGWFVRSFWLDFVTAIPFPPAESMRFLQLGRTIRLIRLLC